MTPAGRSRIALAAVGVLLLALGGGAGWWLAMRSMPMDAMDERSSRTAARGGDEPGMSGTEGMPGMPGMAGDAAPPAMTEGSGNGGRIIAVDPVRLQRIGVRYAVAEIERLDRSIRAEAAVAYDEERMANVTTKIAGWVERLHVDETGQAVRRGQPLLEIYSPELVATQRELLLALERSDRTAEAAGADVENGVGEPEAGSERRGALEPGALVDAARRRLALWGVPESAIERVERTREVGRTLTLDAPVGGVVVEKHVLEGAHVEPGENLYLIADLSTVWVEARVFESDLAAIRVGQPATITVPAYPGETFTGRVSLIEPFLDPSTRSVTVRVEVPNPGRRLKPGMFADVSFDVSTGREAVVVPASAVIETGERAFVLLKRGEGLFEPREVAVAARAGDQVAIGEGVAAGDTLVASANFLIDSEADLMAFMGGMLGMGMRADQMRMGEGAGGRGEMDGMNGMDGMQGREDTSTQAAPEEER